MTGHLTQNPPPLRVDDSGDHAAWLHKIDGLLHGPPLGAYRLVRRLSKGGMGAVFEARNEHTGCRVAIKIPGPWLRPERILREGRTVATASGRHPGIVRIFDCDQLPDGTPYIVMEYVEGELVSDRLRRLGGPLKEHAALRLARQIASVLSAAHAAGIVHRDLKPDNVMIITDPEAHGGERVKVLDFGIARLTAELYVSAGPLPRRGVALRGTPRYMAPEQWRNSDTVDGRADVYSLGIMLYELLGGPLPLPHPLRRVGSRGTMTLLGHMLKANRGNRPDMEAVEAALDDLLLGDTFERWTQGAAQLLRRWSRR